MDDADRYYKVLGLEPGASPEEVKQAYRDLIKVWHPDRFAHDLRLQEKAQEKLKEINEAYDRLQSAGAGSRGTSGPTAQSQRSQRSASDSAQSRPSQATSPDSADQSVARRKFSRGAKVTVAAVAACALALLLMISVQPRTRSTPANVVRQEAPAVTSMVSAQQGWILKLPDGRRIHFDHQPTQDEIDGIFAQLEPAAPGISGFQKGTVEVPTGAPGAPSGATAAMPHPLLDRLRAKYPGAYDDLSDPELAAKLVARYPEYRDEVADLLPRVQPSEQGRRATEKPSATVSPAAGWRNKEAWRRLKTGMTQAEVKSILGEPGRIDGGFISIWYYPDVLGGSVSFDHRGQLMAWREP
jgi:hypothetical protein